MQPGLPDVTNPIPDGFMVGNADGGPLLITVTALLPLYHWVPAMEFDEAANVYFVRIPLTPDPTPTPNPDPAPTPDPDPTPAPTPDPDPAQHQSQSLLQLPAPTPAKKSVLPATVRRCCSSSFCSAVSISGFAAGS